MITTAEPIDLDALRIRHEFIALPGLRASASAVAELLGVSQRHARTALEALVADQFLLRMPDGQYVRTQLKR